MRKIFFLLSALVLTGCGSPLAVQAAALGTPEAQRSATPAATATATVSPTPTVDWQGTAVIAQQTADEARRLNTAATAAHEQREFDKAQMAHDEKMAEEESKLAAIYATGTAYLTSVAATGTQQVIVNAQIAAQQTLGAGQLTATKEAPTQVVSMANAKNYEKYGELDFVIRLFVLAGLGAFLFGIGIFAFFNKQPAGVKPVRQSPARAQNDADLIPLKETVVQYKTNNGQGFGQDLIYKIPCSREQLSELADRVINKNETLGVNRWEGEKSLLTRAVIMRLRQFFMANRMAVSAGAGRVTLNETGLTFLRDWLESNALPHSYAFAPVDDDLPLNMSHDGGAHVGESRGGA